MKLAFCISALPLVAGLGSSLALDSCKAIALRHVRAIENAQDDKQPNNSNDQPTKIAGRYKRTGACKPFPPGTPSRWCYHRDPKSGLIIEPEPPDQPEINRRIKKYN
jgi:hypothetical protein